jgi:hypothetical protein
MAELFVKNDNVDTYIIWGLRDGDSWLQTFFGQYDPLLFDDNLGKKECYNTTLEVLKNTEPAAPLHQSVFDGTPSILPGTIETEHYDTGGQDISYYDVDDTNNGNFRELGDAVDIKDDNGGNIVVVWNAPGEWREYTVDIPNGTYNVVTRIATTFSDARMAIRLGDGPDGTNFVTLGTMNIANSGSFDSLIDDTLHGVVVDNGGNGKVLRLETVGNFFDID